MHTGNESHHLVESEKVPPLVHTLDGSKKPNVMRYVVLLVIVLAGIGSGFILSKTLGNPASKSSGTGTSQTSNSGEPNPQSATTNQVFSDSAEGDLQENTSKMEGSFQLVRPGGVSQTVYLTSSVLDLSKYVGKKVKVWGQTYAAKSAGWLMDVGKIETL
jgi:hypothetical protein